MIPPLRFASWGLLWGSLLAFSFSTFLALGILIHFLGRSLLSISASTPVTGLPVAALFGAYFAGGIVAGSVLGLLWPLVRRRAGAVLVSCVAVLPFFLAVRIAVVGLWGWTVDGVARVLLPSLIAGTVMSLVLWSRTRPRT